MASIADHSDRRVVRQEARREAILDVARPFFLTRGFAATSMSMIASRLGGSKGTLYNYFPRKEDLFAAVMRRECVNQGLPLFDGPEEGGVETTLCALGRGLLDFILSDSAVAIQRVVIAEGERFPELGRIFYDNGPRLVDERLETLLAGMVNSGVLSAADTAVAAEHFKDLVLSGVYRLRLWGGECDLTPGALDRQARVAVEVFLKIYGPDRASGGHGG
jgi:AcrR family transcriptional regulator